MATLQEMIAQKDALERQIADLQRSTRAEAIKKVLALMSEYGLAVADVLGPRRAGSVQATATTKKVEPKYRDASSGKTWTGRGMKPVWVREALSAGKTMADLAI